MRSLVLAALVLLVLMLLSIFTGVADLDSWQLFLVSRLPRTLALVLTGMSLAVAGVVMQMLVRNRFVEPATTGTLQFAALGLLVVLLVNPAAGVLVKMCVAAAFAMVGTVCFLFLIRNLEWHNIVMVPLVGIVFSGVVGALGGFIAYRYDLLQTLYVWMQGDFSALLKGRYELLWLSLPVSLVAYWTADRFTLIGLGREVAAGLGVRYSLIVTWGLLLVAVVSATSLVTAGMIPFLGLVVPNLVSLVKGDNLRQTLPWVAYTGAVVLLFCDIVGRLIYFPYEIPVGTIMGLVGSLSFLYLLYRRFSNA